ncbi:hypothetical protein QO034_09665 [Sedimentitalea sp. JM2-8]|uniref:Bacteriophage HK97-gp10, tail-component n=1 Tax=Sedimentitalea xiamensis TaxID=3050037 RepID=A0ABT7FE41_9RHOB|nr:trypco2 family protein [Sedimentitalea xiamensis]MDK3073376.1 hypothetical protein [Sedimentitalea xiamensis]
MDLKDFIKETIGGIIEATSELRDAYEEQGVIINPPTSYGLEGTSKFEEGSPDHTVRRIHEVEFDVAVTATKETKGGGKAGLRIMSFDAGLNGSHARKGEEISRVKFAIPITLPASNAETRNKLAKEEERAKRTSAMSNYKSRPVV